MELSIGLQRLLQLADHLENGKLGHEVFDFGQVNDYDGPLCGSAGCAMGECPILWPNVFHWDDIGCPTFQNDSTTMSADMRTWFELDSYELAHLFYPNNQATLQYGGEKLYFDATKEQVASNIRAFVALKTT